MGLFALTFKPYPFQQCKDMKKIPNIQIFWQTFNIFKQFKVDNHVDYPPIHYI